MKEKQRLQEKDKGVIAYEISSHCKEAYINQLTTNYVGLRVTGYRTDFLDDFIQVTQKYEMGNIENPVLEQRIQTILDGADDGENPQPKFWIERSSVIIVDLFYGVK